MNSKLEKLPVSTRILFLHRKSGLFDHEWYLRQNPDVRAATKRPFMHFALHGVFEGRPPHARFNPRSYLAANPDVKASGQPPLLHYVLHGYTEKRPLAPPDNPVEERLQSERKRLEKTNRELVKQNELSLSRLHQVQEQLEKCFLENQKLKNDQARLVALRKDHEVLEARLAKSAGAEQELQSKVAAEQSRVERIKKEYTEENELLLLQLHQVQEELEKYLLENQKLKNDQMRLFALEKRHGDLEARHKERLLSEQELSSRASRQATTIKELEAKLSVLGSDWDKVVAARDEFRAKGGEATAENELLLEQLQQVQQELENKFAENQKLQMAQESLQQAHAAFEAERQATARHDAKVHAELAELSAAFEALQGKHSSLETLHASLVVDRDQARAERDNTTKECEALRKTAAERAILISELESRLAEQADRQRQIDEEMAKAEGQLEMLKEFVRPALL